MEAITTKGKTSLPPLFPFGSTPPPVGPPLQVGDGPVRVVWSKADQMFQDILSCCSTDRMPRYKGDLELINHSAGSITSQAYQKRWMRKNELLRGRG
jgi:alpha-mannosidase